MLGNDSVKPHPVVDVGEVEAAAGVHRVNVGAQLVHKPTHLGETCQSKVHVLLDHLDTLHDIGQ